MKQAINGSSIFYRFDGAEDAPVVMLAHAMGASHRMWDWQMASLMRNWRVLRYDLPGHGDSSLSATGYSVEQYVSGAVELMDALRLEKVHFVGISTGGIIGQGLGIQHSERLHSLALCNSWSQSTPIFRRFASSRRAAIERGSMSHAWDETKHLWFTDKFVEEKDNAYCVIHDIFIATQVEGYLGGMSALTDFAYQDDLHLIQSPTLVLSGATDPIAPLDIAAAIGDLIPSSDIIALPGQRHLSNVETPDNFNGVVLPFLNAHRNTVT